MREFSLKTRRHRRLLHGISQTYIPHVSPHIQHHAQATPASLVTLYPLTPYLLTTGRTLTGAAASPDAVRGSWRPPSMPPMQAPCGSLLRSLARLFHRRRPPPLACTSHKHHSNISHHSGNTYKWENFHSKQGATAVYYMKYHKLTYNMSPYTSNITLKPLPPHSSLSTHSHRTCYHWWTHSARRGRLPRCCPRILAASVHATDAGSLRLASA